MKITHPSGESYDLHPGTELEITRYNPFFHELGEQSIPISIPSTSRNLQMLNHPDRPDNINKTSSRLSTSIQSGAFSIVGRQAILSAQRKGNIETSFYFHEGAFYEKISDLTLSEIFQDERITFANIDAAIAFMYNLVANNDSRFGVFEVITDNYTLNQSTLPLRSDGLRVFRTEVQTEEEIEGKTVTIPKGFYLTPFVKVKHVLQKVLTYLGYTLEPSFLDEEPFNEMVFLNDNLDTIVGNSINYVDIVPNITVKTLFDIIRKFNVEFVPDEVTKVITLYPFKESLTQPPAANLTEYAVSIPLINYHNNYKQVKLSSDRLQLPPTISMITSYQVFRRIEVNTGSSDQSSELIEILSQFPTTYLRKNDGYLVRDGFRGGRAFTEKLAPLAIPYYAGGPLPIEEYQFPDVVPDIYTTVTRYSSDTPTYNSYPYVGSGRALQSKITFSDESEQSDAAGELKAMLCLMYRKPSHCVGTLYSHDNEGNKLWDYSLMWWGEEGIYEKFWRSRDTLMRNAFLDINVDLLLPENHKLNLPSTRLMSFQGQKYLLSELQYSTKPKSIGTASLKSIKLQEPISEAKPQNQYFRTRTYKWKLRSSQSWTSPVPGVGTGYRFITEPVAFYPEDPTPAQYAAGGKYHQRIYNVEWGRHPFDETSTKLGDGTLTVWLEPALY